MDTKILEIDWLKELLQGGNTSVALVVLIMVMVAFTVERLMRLRKSYICPHGLVTEVLPLWHKEAYEDILNACKKYPSTLAVKVEYLVKHREAPADLLISGANDIALREMRLQSQRNAALAVIASLAPLLGLLGTMIGMIESFKLVEIYGDDGGASMLAGSISKALITTAVGLIIAIPALSLFHYFKHRIGLISLLLEEEFEILINNWLLRQQDEPQTNDLGEVD